MKTKILLIILALFFISSVSAMGPLISINITGNNLTVKGYITYDSLGKYPAPVISDFSDILNCVLNTTSTNSTNLSYLDCSKVSYFRDIPLISTQNNSLVVSTDANQQAYQQCLDERAKYNAGLNACTDAKNLQGEFKDNYTQCTAQLTVCQGEKGIAAQKQIDAETKYNEGINSKYIWGTIGLIIGLVGALWYNGNIFKPKVKDAEEKFNRQQAG